MLSPSFSSHHSPFHQNGDVDSWEEGKKGNSKNALKRKKDGEEQRIRGEGMLRNKGWRDRKGGVKRFTQKEDLKNKENWGKSGCW